MSNVTSHVSNVPIFGAQFFCIVYVCISNQIFVDFVPMFDFDKLTRTYVTPSLLSSTWTYCQGKSLLYTPLILIQTAQATARVDRETVEKPAHVKMEYGFSR